MKKKKEMLRNSSKKPLIKRYDGSSLLLQREFFFGEALHVRPLHSVQFETLRA